jgi:sugar phosphate isomerase/epimerase
MAEVCMSMRRREFIQRGSLVLTAPFLASTFASGGLDAFQQADPFARIGIATWSFRHLLTTGQGRGGRAGAAPGAAGAAPAAPARALMTPLDAPKFVREELGLRQLEIINSHLEEQTIVYAEKLRAAAEAVGVKFINYQMGGNLSSPDATARTNSINQLKEGMKIAAVLGAPTVRADVGGGANTQLDLAITADSYKQLADFGATINVMPMPENHGGHSSDPDKLVSIMKAVDPRVKAIVDWGNWTVQDQAQRIEFTRKLLPYTGLVSAKFDRFDEAYKTNYDVAELVKMVEATGYRGKYSIEITTAPVDMVRAATIARDTIAANLAK